VGAGVIQVNGLGRRELRSQVPPYKGWQDDIGRQEAEVPPGRRDLLAAAQNIRQAPEMTAGACPNKYVTDDGAD
jgi:hypothetical protein